MKAALENGAVPKSIPSIPAARLKGHEGPVHAVRFTRDGKYCVSAGNDRTLRLWNPIKLDPACTSSRLKRSQLLSLRHSSIPIDALPSCLPIQSYSNGHSHPIHAVAINDTSTKLLSSSDRTLVLTDVVTTQALRRFHGHSSRINSVTFSENETSVYLSASYDGTVRLWDGRSSNNKEPIQVLSEATDSVTTVLMDQESNPSPSCNIVTSGVDGIVRTYDIRKGILRKDDIGEPIIHMSFSRDKQGLLLNGLDGILRFMERDTGMLLNEYTGSHIAGKYGLECAISAHDDVVVTGSEDGSVVFYDLVHKNRVQKLEGHTRPTCSIATHPNRDNCSITISASYDGSAVVWANLEETKKWNIG